MSIWLNLREVNRKKQGLLYTALPNVTSKKCERELLHQNSAYFRNLSKQFTWKMILYHACYNSYSLIQEFCTYFQKSRFDCMVIASAFTVPHFYISPRCRTRCSEQNYSNLNNRCWQQQHLPVSEGKNAANSTFWWWAERPTANMKTKAECYMKDVLDEKNIYSNVIFCIFSNTNIWKNALVA